MTNRERFLRAMHYEPVDRPPFFMDGLWPDTWERWYREGYPKGKTLEEFLGVEGLHYHGLSIDTFLIPPIPPVVLEEHDQWVTRRDCYGATLRDFKDQTTMPMWLDYMVKTPADLYPLIEKLQWNDGLGRIPANWPDKVREIRASGLGCVASGGSYYGNLRNLMGVEALSVMYYDAPEALRAYNDAYFNVIMRTLEIAFRDLRGEILYVSFGEDFAYKTAPLLSPAMYREFIMPYHRQVTEFAKANGVDLFWFDSDGNITEMIPHLLAAGVNMMYPIEVAAGMDPCALRKTFGRDLRMIGGIDKRALAQDKAAIRREVFSRRDMVREGGYLPRVDHSVGTDISLANFVYYFDCMKELYGL